MMVDRQNRSDHRIEHEHDHDQFTEHTTNKIDDKSEQLQHQHHHHHQPVSSMLSIASDHSGDMQFCHHEAFMLASPTSTFAHSDDGSCDSHETHSTHISSVSNLTSHTMKSTAPKASQPNSRRNSIVNVNGEVLTEPFTVLQLSNSETVDTKDVYVMANAAVHHHHHHHHHHNRHVTTMMRMTTV
mmetsp:Transcript_23685/g.37948  ORF Transcript_23685/g.37948 Transcript_23685/m.37948 type:complete len:185 (-) Transcript_23685:33-587(-)